MRASWISCARSGSIFCCPRAVFLDLERFPLGLRELATEFGFRCVAEEEYAEERDAECVFADEDVDLELVVEGFSLLPAVVLLVIACALLDWPVEE